MATKHITASRCKSKNFKKTLKPSKEIQAKLKKQSLIENQPNEPENLLTLLLVSFAERMPI